MENPKKNKAGGLENEREGKPNLTALARVAILYLSEIFEIGNAPVVILRARINRRLA